MKIFKLLIVGLWFTVGALTNAIAEETAPEEYLEIKDAVKHFEVQDETRVVSIVGQIKNYSHSYIGDVYVEVQFFNSAGELIDAVNQQLYSLVVPPEDSVAFTVSNIAQRAEGSYSSFKPRVTYAVVKSAYCGSKKKKDIFKILSDWAPLIGFFMLWLAAAVYFQRKASQEAKKSQAKMLSLIEEQNTLTLKKNEQFSEFLEIVRRYTDKNK